MAVTVDRDDSFFISSPNNNNNNNNNNKGCESKSDASNNNRGDQNHLKITQTISEQHTGKARKYDVTAKKKATLGTAHILREVPM
jgi:hypothetical protein